MAKIKCKPCKPNAKGCCVSGILLAIIGATLFILAFTLLPTLIKNTIRSGIIKAVIVDSPTATNYNNWAGQQSIDNYYQQYFYAWNLTNPKEVLDGELPIFEQVGPFNYKYEFTYSNVSFMDGGNLATYTQTKSFIYQADMSPNDPETVMITNFNPAYLGLMYQMAPNSELLHLPAEDLLFAIGGCGQMSIFLDYLSSDNFTHIVYFTQNPSIYKKESATIVESLNFDLDYYYEQWANSTTIPGKGSNWIGMMVSYGGTGNTPSGISLESAQMILNAENQYSILNQDTGIDVWISAMLKDSNSINQLINELQISSTQIDMVLNWWLNSFSPQFTTQQLYKMCGIPDLELLGVCQFITALPTNGRSLSNYSYVGQPFQQGAFEIPLNTGFKLSMTTQQAFNNLFNPANESSILNLNGMVNFITAVKSFNLKEYDISIEDAAKLLEYITLKISNTYTFSTVQGLYQNNGGLIVTRSVQDWLWTCDDSILDFLGVDQPCALQQNNTVNKPSTIFTGIDDLSMTNQMFEYQEQTYLTIWNEPVQVTGFTESGQFPPLLSADADLPETLTLFEENVIRPLTLSLSGETSVQGVTTQRYYLLNNSFPISNTFKTSIPGFVNLTDLQNLPIYVSLWDMYEVPPQYSINMMKGLNQTYESAAVPLDLEPITGNALYYNLKLQVNLAIPEHAVWFSNSSIYKNMQSNRFYPVLKIGQTATPSDSNINLLHSQFKLIKILGYAPVLVISVIGGILLLSGSGMTFFGIRKLKQRQNKGYRSISVNEDDGF